MRSNLIAALGFCIALSPSFVQASANIVIQNNDPVGVGFNDSTPVDPVGGNQGTTLGEQRLIAFQAAADKWGQTISSPITIVIGSSWKALPCSSTSAVLGSAGPTQVWRNFQGARFASTYYVVALANALSGQDLSGGNAQVAAQFNVNLGQPGCLESRPFYLGLDNQHGELIDLVTVLTHEFAHGLGFLTVTNGRTGAYLNGSPCIFDRYLFDDSRGLPWIWMSQAGRARSAVTGQLVWNGPQVDNDAQRILTGGYGDSSRPHMYAPSTYASGSSVSHWDVSATPNQLMEPAINLDLQHEVAVPFDLTYSLLQDIGW
jgi:hypothetical protein